MKRLSKALYALAFLGVCAGAMVFLHLFTQAESGFSYPTWEAGAVVSPDGAETAFDPAALPPELEPGEAYRYALTLPEGRRNGEFLIFETAGLAISAYLDGQELWRSAAVQPPDTANQSQAQIALPAGGGETLAMELSPLSDTALVPPILRLSYDPTDQAGTIAYANYYGLAAGASALAAVLLWGLFLLGLAHGKRNWTLLLPTLAAVLLTVHRLAVGYGAYFLPQALQGPLSSPWLEGLTALALLAYLLFHRERIFWKTLGLLAAWSAGALAAAALVSHLRDGYLAQYLSFLAAQLQGGFLTGTLYWLIWWLVLVCAALSAWDLARSIVRAQGTAQALALKNQLVMENYRSMEDKLRESASLRHGFSAQVAVLDAAVRERNWESVERCVAAWKRDTSQETTRFTEHTAVNAILQDAAGRAREAGVKFEATAIIPKSIPIPDEDICALLINILDNALDGASRTPEGREKIIRFRMRVEGKFLPILCENTFDGQIATDAGGGLKTTKPDPASHGFGLAQMRAVAEKYDSVLSVSWTDEWFTVQTALQFPEK